METQKHRHTQKEAGNVKTEAETGVLQVLAKEYQGLLGGYQKAGRRRNRILQTEFC